MTTFQSDFEYPDGVKDVAAETGTTASPRGWVYLFAESDVHGTQDAVSVHFSPERAREFADAIYETAHKAEVEALEAKRQAFPFEVGDKVRLLPAATAADDCLIVLDGTSTVEIVDGIDSDGDAYVKALDGESVGCTRYVDAKFLAAIEEGEESEIEDDPFPVGTVVRMTKQDCYPFVIGRVSKARGESLCAMSDEYLVHGLPTSEYESEGGWYARVNDMTTDL